LYFTLDKLNSVYYIYIVNIMGTQERKQREKKEMARLILDAALKLFIDEGYENVSIRKLADKIEYSPAAIYLYFKDKDEIFFTLHREALDKFYQAQLTVQSIQDPYERLIAHGRAYIQFAIDNPELYDLMFIMKEPVKNLSTPDQWKTESRSYDLLKKNVKECIEANLIANTDVEIVSFSLWAFVHGISSLKIRRGLMIPDEYIQYLINGAFEFLKTGLGK
jgi:AcrR family transcriptional regulator